MGETINTGLLVTVAVFVLAVIFGFVLWADAKKTTKSEKAAAAAASSTVPPPAVEVKSQQDSWQKSAERFKSFAGQPKS